MAKARDEWEVELQAHGSGDSEYYTWELRRIYGDNGTIISSGTASTRELAIEMATMLKKRRLSAEERRKARTEIVRL